jgi:ParB-like chromosome segregation protein Spo0J
MTLVRKIADLKVRAPFSTLFPMDERVLDAVVARIRQRGFDSSKPIDIWAGEDVVIDGHTRLEAAQIAELDEVPVFPHDFPTRSRRWSTRCPTSATAAT